MFPYWRARIRACLIDELRLAHRFWSIRVSAMGAALSAAWAALPPDDGIAMPGAPWIGPGLFIAVAFLRILHQPGMRG